MSLIARTPGHSLQRFQEVYELPVVERPEDPGVMCANKAAAIRHETAHRIADSRMIVAAGVDAVIPSTTRDVIPIWYSHFQIGSHYTANQAIHQWGCRKEPVSRRPYSVPSAKALFGEQLKTLRLDRELSQEKLSEMCDFHRTHVGRLERAERTVTFDAIQRLSFALQVLPRELLRNMPIPTKLPLKKKKKNKEK